eukprot:jgi/Bigna1/69737/fgenesh1_pg.9_\
MIRCLGQEKKAAAANAVLLMGEDFYSINKATYNSIKPHVNKVVSMSKKGHRDARADANCTDAKVAVCLIGNRLEKMGKIGFIDNFLKYVVAPLGGIANVDIFVNTDKKGMSSKDFQDLEYLWPSCRRTARAFEANVKAPVISPQCKAMLVIGQMLIWDKAAHILQQRFTSCYEQVVDEEIKCLKKYSWVFKHRPDSLFVHDALDANILAQVHPMGSMTVKQQQNQRGFFVTPQNDNGFNDMAFLMPRSFAHLALNFSATPKCLQKSLLKSICPPALRINAIYPECLLSYNLQTLSRNGQIVHGALCHPLLARDPDAAALGMRSNHSGNAKEACQQSRDGKISSYEFCAGQCDEKCRNEIIVAHQHKC